MTLSFVPDNGAATIVFDGTSDVWAGHGTEGFFEVPVDLRVEQFSAGDGGSLVSQRRAPRPLLLMVDIGSSLRTTWGSILSAFSGGGTFQYNNGSEVRELRNVVLEAPARSLTGHDMYARADDAIPVSLLALDPWWYGPAVDEVVDLNALPGTGWNPDVDWNPSLPWTGGDDLTWTIAGDAPVSPLWGFEGPLNLLQVQFGQIAWRWQSPLLPETGLFGTVDTRRGSAGPRKGSEIYSDPEQSTLWARLTENSRLFDLPAGAQTVTVTVTGESVGAELTMRYEPRWLLP